MTHTDGMRLHVGMGLLLTVLTFAGAQSHAQTSVPYVGCPGDGQTGPYTAEKGSPKPVNLSPAIAGQLAWYEYKGDVGQFGTLGPRGWNCYIAIGSDGLFLYVAPEPLNSAKILEHRNWKGFQGPAIQLSAPEGGTSGRFEVAQVVARVFPAHHAYARKIIAEGFEPASDFQFGPFRADRLTYKSKELVEFTTPAHHKGLGTMSLLLPSDRSITGFALLSIGRNVDTELLQLDIRLPDSLRKLSTILVEQAEQESVK